ncbi:MAG: hypothetical protein ABIE55_04255 [Candidatus Aenigmatarchaeota archaeon]
MGILDKFKRKKEEVRLPEDIGSTDPDLPGDLERFRTSQPDFPRTDFYDKPLEVPNANQVEKIDLVIQKLDTIDTRLKLIEEKMKRY